MYGFMHQALVRWIKQLEYGEAILESILQELEVKGAPDDFFRHYTDAQTMHFVELAAKATGYSVDQCMLEAGSVSTSTFVSNGYEPVLRTLGKDFYTMLTNLDSLHDNFLSAFPEMKVPLLRPERNADNSMSIHYYSQRRGLAPFMMGSLKCAAKQLYDLDIDIHHRVKRSKDSDHDVFHVFMDIRGFPDEPLEADADKKMATAALSSDMTNRLFPWHFAVSRDMKIVSLGKHLASRMKKDCIGMHASKLFEIVRPVEARWTFGDFEQRCNKPFMFVTKPKRMLTPEEYMAMLVGRQQQQQQPAKGRYELDNIVELHAKRADGKDTKGAEDDGGGGGERGLNGAALETSSEASSIPLSGCPFDSSATSSVGSRRSSIDAVERRARCLRKPTRIKLHGEVVYDEGKDVLLFVGNPLVQSLEELEAQGIDLADLPIHSHGREVLYGSMCQAVSASNSNEVEAKLADLDKSMAEVNATKEKIDKLLQSILPSDVASSLARGQVPPAETYKKVTVLFSDIVGFTSISSEVPSLEVMDMLHEMFVKFDDLADKHGCYKVETIGDAYMVVAGCPDECEDHAERIANLAIEMVRVAESVRSPLDGEPLRIRVGIHSGPVMAGVVGHARPRYCLFGDTVNVASRMESNGLPGCIQATYRFLRCLPEEHDLTVAPRGRISIKGKGTLKTFLVLGHNQSEQPPLLPAPDDDEVEVSEELRMIRAHHQMWQAMQAREHIRALSPEAASPKGRRSTGFYNPAAQSRRLSRVPFNVMSL